MPFHAQRDGEDEDLVVPEEVPNGETVRCPACDGRMRPRGGGSQRARHFLHVDNLGTEAGSGCDGLGTNVGESKYHRKLKSLVVSGLRSRFEEFDVAYCGLEYEFDVSTGPNLVNDQRADVILQFKDQLRIRTSFSAPASSWKSSTATRTRTSPQ